MARPNSKYFASVISKLVAAKRKEKIVIDEAFKMQLRSALLTRASLPVKQEKVSFAEFFMKWRFAFAALPSALIVMIVAAQFLNMPVSIPTEQMVPTEGRADVLDEDVLGEEAADSGEKLETFPGEMVMPKKLLDFGTEDFADSQAVTTTTSKKSTPAPVQEVPVPAPAPAPAPYYLFGFPFTYVPSQTTNQPEEVAGEVYQAQESNVYQAPQTTSTQGTIYHVGGNTETGSAAGTGATAGTGTIVDTGTTEQQVVPYSLPVPYSPVVQTTEPQVVQPQPVVVQPQVIVETPVTTTYTRVQYQLVLTQAKKSAMEADVIPSLVDGRTNYSVKVYDKGSGVVAVSITFSDGSTLLRYYKYNERTGNWDKVQYIERYYYDDSLTYIRTEN